MVIIYTWVYHNNWLNSLELVGVDVTREIKAVVDPRKFITLVGASNISNVQPKKDEQQVYKKSSALEIEDFDNDDFEVDIDLDLLKQMTDDSVLSSNKTPPPSSPAFLPQEEKPIPPPPTLAKANSSLKDQPSGSTNITTNVPTQKPARKKKKPDEL